MEKKIGQRWRYKCGNYDIIFELLDNDVKKNNILILQSNEISINGGYTVGKKDRFPVEIDSRVWIYLEGQEAP